MALVEGNFAQAIDLQQDAVERDPPNTNFQYFFGQLNWMDRHFDVVQADTRHWRSCSLWATAELAKSRQFMHSAMKQLILLAVGILKKIIFCLGRIEVMLKFQMVTVW